MTTLLTLRNAIVISTSLTTLAACQTLTQAKKEESPVVSTAYLDVQPMPIIQQSEAHAPVQDMPLSSNIEPQKKQVLAKKPLKPTKKTVLPYQVDNLWQRITMQFVLPIPKQKQINERKSWYLSHPHYMDTVSKRAEPFLYHIVQEIERRKLPLELALLPIVESDFDAKAFSSQGAAGIWQLMPTTAKHFELNIEPWYDARLDPHQATLAALDYLQYLNKKYRGDWLLSIAAYNSGEGRVDKAINKNKKLRKKTDFWSLSLPTETTNYVPKLLALAALAKQNAHKKWPVIANKPTTVTVDFGQQFDVLIAAKLTKTDMRTLYHLNPAYLGDKSALNGPHTLQIPIEKAPYFDKRQHIKADMLGMDHYQVKKHDSLYQLAKRFNSSIKELKQLNQLSSDTIKIGQVLQLPIQKPIQLMVDYQISPFIVRAEAPEKIKVSINYKVKPGDTLWEISRLYDVNYQELAKWNNLKAKSILKQGKILTIWLEQNRPTDTINFTEQNSVLNTPTWLIRGQNSINPR